MSDQQASPAQRASAEFRERLGRLDRQASAAPMGSLDHRGTRDLRGCLGLPDAMARAAIEVSREFQAFRVASAPLVLKACREFQAASAPRVRPELKA
ncbi:hypothetical protein [Methylobacterium sp.]|uniref:hypothetical protein n=1 Tax=Methylobacterium sp. TaxID=409 RepID=UPI0025EC02DE|nr:hypothetical protein [Methylobacterium sp.]MBY0259591.1 hypothetical protein [Methylobacterium sp.]